MLSQPASTSSPTRARLRWLAIAWAAVVMVLSGCTGLPKDADRPVSVALSNPGDTPLGQWVAGRRSADGSRYASGFALLSGPQAAYGSRLALVDAAQKTLDLQYYAIHADASSERLLLSVVAAAQRGVRVRVLLDDYHSTGRDAQVMRLAFVPNIEMRMFNPLAGARGSPIGRMLSLLGDFSRVQQRMHNKLFIADNAMAVAGGRNLGDAYFGNSDAGNFVDLDVLAAGPIVQHLSGSFDSYWNNERAYPVQSLVTQAELDALRESIRAADLGRSGRTPGQGVQTVPATRPHTTGADNTAPQGSRIWDFEPMDLKRMPFVWAAAAVLADQPAKIPADSSAIAGTAPPPTTPPATSPAPPDRSADTAGPAAIAIQGPRAVAAAMASLPRKTPLSAEAVPAMATTAGNTAKTPSRVPPALAHGPVGEARNAAPVDTDAGDAPTDTVVDGLLQLMGQARRDLLIISPYFVPGPDMKAAFAAARARGVRVRVLTNSLASNDAPIAHAGYARHRPLLLAMGVELYEMHSELPALLRGAFGATGSTGKAGDTGPPRALGNSRAMLHSKLMIVDGRLLAIGSMNLDLRSQRQNTEVALLIRSTALARQARSQLDPALKEAAWQVEATDQGLRWRAPQGSSLEDTTTEPDASAPLRLMLQLLGPLAPDHLL